MRILENPSALPRAWIVHTASQVGPGSDAKKALAPLASGQPDADQTALPEDPPPQLEPSADPALDRAPVTHDEADRVAIQHTSTNASGLLVVSEVSWPAWKAHVDGQPTRLWLADGALPAVVVRPGEHSVDLRFEPHALALGIAISSMAVPLLALLGLVVLMRTRARLWARCM